MYSVVLATMLTAGAQSTTWCHRSACHGCHGCGGYNAFSVGHGCHNYCSGWYCSGCGGGCACSGWSCHGCHSSCSVTVVLCSGCHGCNGYRGCNGCFGGSGCFGCNGCFAFGGCSGCHGVGGAGGGGGVVIRDRVVREQVGRPAVDGGPTNEAERRAVEDLLRRMREQQRKEKDRKKRDRDDDDVSTDQARIVVRLPADARLWVDQVPCPLEGTVRAFDTPALESGQRYAYTLRVELERNGQRLQESRRVPLTAAERVEVDFNNLGAVRTAQN
jgi:uncharacterized protein (TIGR03000 family)